MAEEATGEQPGRERNTRDESGDSVSLDLTTWTLATMNTVVLVVALVVGVHASGALADLLGALNTLVGVAVFLFLWGLFVFSVRWVLSDASMGESPLRSLALRGTAAGGTAGICFPLLVLAVAVVPAVLTGSITPRAILLFGAIATGLAALVGAVLGFVAALFNAGLYRFAGRVV
jgi:hypothetical protein